jgi:hypothetical protein
LRVTLFTSFRQIEFSETQLPVLDVLGTRTSCRGCCLSGLLWVVVLIA